MKRIVHSEKDVIEWEETLDLISTEDESVISDLSHGQYVTVTKELFEKMVDEINQSRIKNRVDGEGVELIVLEGVE